MNCLTKKSMRKTKRLFSKTVLSGWVLPTKEGAALKGKGPDVTLHGFESRTSSKKTITTEDNVADNLEKKKSLQNEKGRNRLHF